MKSSIFVLVDRDGDVHSVATSIGNLKKDVGEDPVAGKKLLSLSEGATVEKNLERR
ncbi:MAG: hypothetical protein WD342_15730 [Verrucomicrobiales bacterium]